ncbi:MAG: PIN domain-containing protein [Verrucomicrobia bacterium]|jgi:toxin-antitoxin system PIN domain toxin|nr:PIN domain-containing protein [Verrucomicrobiota bacterium]|tara:strand:+ start:1168 stop:1599 length:432 start_codon:yes stop_codon:yes gene_type:complete
MIAVDTNILVSAHREDSPWHGKAKRKVTKLANSGKPWAITWPSVHEFLAIVTHPKIYDPPTPMPTALAAIKAWQGSPNLRFLGEGPGYFEKISTLATNGMIRGPKIHDARIAAICIHHGVKKLWTADRNFSSFPELSCENPLV